MIDTTILILLARNLHNIFRKKKPYINENSSNKKSTTINNLVTKENTAFAHCYIFFKQPVKVTAQYIFSCRNVQRLNTKIT